MAKKLFKSSFISQLVVVSCLILIANFAKAQSPWVKAKGTGYGHIALSSIPTYSKVFNGNFSMLKEQDRSITEFSLQAYMEHGFRENWQVTANLPFHLIRQGSNKNNPSITESAAIAGFGNIQIGTKYQIKKSPIPFALGLDVGLPTGASDDATGLRTAYQSSYFVPYLSVGQGFDKSYAYIYGGAGLFVKDMSNDIRFGGEYGRFFFDRLWAILSVNIRESFFDRNTDELDTYLATSLYVNNQYYSAFAIKLMYEFNDKSGINFSTNLISPRANNLPFQRPVSLGYFVKW